MRRGTCPVNEALPYATFRLVGLYIAELKCSNADRETFTPHMFVASSLSRRVGARWLLICTLCLAVFTALSGCTRLHEHLKPEMVYVVAKQTYLRDRVAAVSNRVALVGNGEPLEVVEHGRRFLRTKTSKGEVGWIEDHMVIDQATHDQFTALQQQHAHDSVVATGVLRDDLYLHVKPGRDTDRFYLLPENEKLQLLVRASVPKPAPPQGFLPPPHAVVKEKKAYADGKPAPDPPVPMEDWWLVRDSRGQVGWLLSRRLDVDVPDEIGGYSEGQKIVGAYVLTKVYDPESSLPGKLVPEYVSVTNAFKDGLPYDFDQVRVFTWNVKKHRYETAYRQRNIEGYLPITIGQNKTAKGDLLPEFSVIVATRNAVTVDPVTGAARPAQTTTLTYQLESGMVKRVTPTGVPGQTPISIKPKAEEAHAHHRSGKQKKAGGG
jgi:SH3-like domain-containing protein